MCLHKLDWEPRRVASLRGTIPGSTLTAMALVHVAVLVVIPVVDDVIVEVNLKQRRITVDWDADF